MKLLRVLFGRVYFSSPFRYSLPLICLCSCLAISSANAVVNAFGLFPSPTSTYNLAYTNDINGLMWSDTHSITKTFNISGTGLQQIDETGIQININRNNLNPTAGTIFLDWIINGTVVDTFAIDSSTPTALLDGNGNVLSTPLDLGGATTLTLELR